MPNITKAPQSRPVSTSAYAPSVPISVYRQLAAELQATRVMLDSLNAQNQQLAQQNQLLRREIEKIVNSVVHLQQMADTSVQAGWSQTPYPYPELRNQPSYPVAGPKPMPGRPRPVSGVNPSAPVVDVPNVFMDGTSGGVYPENLVREQAENRYRYRSQMERTSDINGWWYTLGVVLVVMVAFGAGFLIMKPFLMKR